MTTDALLPPYLTAHSDRVIFGQCPMLMVPAKGKLPACGEGERRYLAARDGIWIEARTPALHLRIRLSEVSLPYGQVNGLCELAGGLLPEQLTKDVVACAKASGPTEAARLAIWLPDEQRYDLIEPAIDSASAGHVTYAAWTDSPGRHLAIDIHTHGNGPAYFSPIDDQSDRSVHEPHLSVVLGRCRGRIEVVTRACIGNHLIKLAGEPFSVPVRAMAERLDETTA